MKFLIGGAWAYRVRVTREKLLDADGRELLGQILYDEQEILLSAGIHPHRRLAVLLHELRHAWDHHCPGTRTDEEECQFSATMMAAMHADLNGQGGITKLESLEPERPPGNELRRVAVDEPWPEITLAPLTTVHPVESIAPPRGGRAECAGCGQMVPGGRIVTGRVRMDRTFGGRVVDRALYCDGCGHVQRWTEGVDWAGCPNGAVCDGPAFERGAAVEAFLREHPEATGVVVR